MAEPYKAGPLKPSDNPKDFLPLLAAVKRDSLWSLDFLVGLQTREIHLLSYGGVEELVGAL